MQQKLSWRIPFTLYATVFLTGAAVLIIEIAAVRLLTPIFGSSLTVLSSVLSTILFALSVGYFFGGRIADRYPHPLPLYSLITFSGLIILITHIFTLFSTASLGTVGSLVAGPLLFSICLFFLPAMLLGMDSPYVIKILTENTPKEVTGRYVGSTFFFSTLGSISGSLAAGFWLIPTYGVTTTITMTGMLITAIGLIGPLLLPKLQNEEVVNARTWLSMIAFTGILVFFLLLSIHVLDQPDRNVIHEYDGLYSNIRVEEFTTGMLTIRVLRRDTNNSSAVFMENNDYVFDYAKFTNLYPSLVPDAERFLLIGGGAYTIPRHITAYDPNIVVDVVEIEPSLFPLAQTYFGLVDTSRITNYTEDARQFLRHTNTSYDVIFTDAVGTAHDIPFHLTTVEFFSDLKARLKPDGIMMANYLGTLDAADNTLTDRFINTIRTVFPEVAVYQLRPEFGSTREQNFIIIARNGTTPIDIDPTIDISDFDTTATTIGELEVPLSYFNNPRPIILTDDHAPVEFLKAEQLRRVYAQHTES